MVKQLDNELPARVAGKVLDETPKAYKFQAEERTQYHWLPKSQCKWDAHGGYMYIVRWMARDKGFVP